MLHWTLLLKNHSISTDDGGLEIDEDGSRDVFSGSGFGEEGVEGVVLDADVVVGWHCSVRSDAVFQAIYLKLKKILTLNFFSQI